MRIKLVRWTGLVLLVGSLILLTGWTVWDDTRTWDLARDTPISLAEGSHFSTGVSRVNMSARYGIVIYVSDAVVDQFDTLHDQLECQMGVYSWPQGPTSGSRQNVNSRRYYVRAGCLRVKKAPWWVIRKRNMELRAITRLLAHT